MARPFSSEYLNLFYEKSKSHFNLEYLSFPRLPGCTEIGLTAVEKRNWEDYKKRLVAHQTIFNQYEIETFEKLVKTQNDNRFDFIFLPS